MCLKTFSKSTNRFTISDRSWQSIPQSRDSNIKSTILKLKACSKELLTGWKLDVVSWLLEFYVLATSKDMSEWAYICNSAHSWSLYSVASLRDQATTTNTMTQHPTPSHYPVTHPPNYCPILIMLSVWVGSNKFQFLNHWFHLTTI